MGKKRILITGASGFIGRNSTEYFSSSGEYDVLACTDEVVDLRDDTAVKKIARDFSPTAVIHCAGVGGTRKTGYDQGNADVVAINLRIFFNLVRAVEPGVRILHLGSGAEYDFRHYQPKMKEEFFDSYVPEDSYGFSKYVIAKYIEKRPNITCLRIFALYSRYEDYTYKFISNTIVKSLLKMPIVINRNVRFDYLYIGDLLEVLQRFIEHPPADRYYNITPCEPIDLLSIVKIIDDVSGVKNEVQVLNGGMNREYSGDNARLMSQMPDLKFTSYIDGINELYGYLKANLAAIDVEQVRRDEYRKYCRKTF